MGGQSDRERDVLRLGGYMSRRGLSTDVVYNECIVIKNSTGKRWSTLPSEIGFESRVIV